MKQLFTLLIVLSISSGAFAQYWFTESNAPAGNIYTNSAPTYSFTIDSLAYFYTGDSTSANFVAFNINTITWSNKAKFPGTARKGASGFVINGLGYLAGGNYADCYQYNPVSNAWTPVANCPDTVSGAYSFAIGSFGYLVSGFNNTTPSLKCFKFDPSLNQWTQLNNVPWAKGMGYGISASIGGQGYCCTGWTSTGGFLPVIDSLWMYTPGTDSWTAKAIYPGDYSGNGSGGFDLGTCSLGCGTSSQIYMLDDGSTGISGTRKTWTYNPGLNTWTSVASAYPFSSEVTGIFTPCQIYNPISFSINDKVFAGYTNYHCTTPAADHLYEFNPTAALNITSFTPDTLCEAGLLTVTFSSNISFGSSNSFAVQFFPSNLYSKYVAASAPGTYTFQAPSGLLSGAGVATLSGDSFSIVSTDPAAVFSGSKGIMKVKKGPSAQPFLPLYGICNGNPVTIKGFTPNKAGSYPEQYFWATSPGAYNSIPDSTVPLLQLTSSVPSTYYFKSVYTSTGCWYYDTIHVASGSYPYVIGLDTLIGNCPNDSTTISVNPAPNVSYTWYTTNTFLAMATSFKVSSTSVGQYWLYATDTTTSCQVYYHILDSVRIAPKQPICFVTVDSASTHNVLVWEKTNKGATDSFYVYREITTNNYQRIGAIGGGDLSQYDDYAANPNVTGYRYKISAVDTCGHEGAISHYHNTIHLQYLGSGNLIWNAYVIDSESTPVTSFDVYRDSLADGNWQVMVSVPGTQTTATDVNFSLNPNAKYRIQANWAYSCSPSRSAAGNVVVSNVITQNDVSTGIGTDNQPYTSRLYPNPAKDLLSVESSLFLTGRVNVVMYDITGNIISTTWQQEAGKVTFSTARLPAGMYSLKFNVSDKLLNVRFVKAE